MTEQPAFAASSQLRRTLRPEDWKPEGITTDSKLQQLLQSEDYKPVDTGIYSQLQQTLQPEYTKPVPSVSDAGTSEGSAAVPPIASCYGCHESPDAEEEHRWRILLNGPGHWHPYSTNGNGLEFRQDLDQMPLE